jgi:hypothetical protein
VLDSTAKSLSSRDRAKPIAVKRTEENYSFAGNSRFAVIQPRS